MTREEFYNKHCLMCGTQRCFMDDESISTCGYYNGEIPDIPKKKSVIEMIRKGEI